MPTKILIIDDNEGDRKCLSLALHELGKFDLAFAETGEEGIEKVMSASPDIVILDTVLPKIDGYETCRRIKQNAAQPTTIVMLTGVADAVSASLAKEAGADKYTIKTIDLVEFKKCMNTIKLSNDNDPV